MNHSTTSLKNKIALITGGSRGLRRDMALNLAQHGADIILTYQSRQDQANEVVNEIRTLGRQAQALHLDVSRSEEFAVIKQTILDVLQRNWGTEQLDILVNNAGIIAHQGVTDTSEKVFDELFQVQLKGPYFLTQELLSLLPDGGRIINISTGLARFSIPGYAAYAAMKSGIETYTRYLAKELGARSITANVVAPGAINTDMNKASLEADPNLEAMLSSVTALGRVGVAEDIGGVVAFLATEDARWITGQRIEVSGGMFL